MKNFRNFVLGAAVAGVCLAPAAWADGSLLVKGQVPERAFLSIATVFTVGDALAAARSALPHLTHCAIRVIGGA